MHKAAAARTGKRDSQVIEESLRRDLGLDDLTEIWAKVTPAAEEEGSDLAADELRTMRRQGTGVPPSLRADQRPCDHSLSIQGLTEALQRSRVKRCNP